MESELQFEKYRQLAISDSTNPNHNDFTHHKLSIESHFKYGVILDDGHPVCMGGMMEIKDNLYRLKNRFYIFPQYRTKTSAQLIALGEVLVELMLKPLTEMTPGSTHIMTMANRRERNHHFKAFARLHQAVWPDHWTVVDGYIQTGRGMNRRSWQNAITDNPSYPFETLTHDQWLLLKDYEH